MIPAGNNVSFDPLLGTISIMREFPEGIVSTVLEALGNLGPSARNSPVLQASCYTALLWQPGSLNTNGGWQEPCGHKVRVPYHLQNVPSCCPGYFPYTELGDNSPLHLSEFRLAALLEEKTGFGL